MLLSIKVCYLKSNKVWKASSVISIDWLNPLSIPADHMGSGASSHSSPDEPVAEPTRKKSTMALSNSALSKRNNEIELQLAKDKISFKKTLKILLLGMFFYFFVDLIDIYVLGGPESGKSTIFKQMKYV